MTSRSEPRNRARGQFLRGVRGVGLVLLLIVVTIPGWVVVYRQDASDPADADLLTESFDRRGGGPAHRTWALLGSALSDFDHSRAEAVLAAFQAGNFSDAAWILEQSERLRQVSDSVLAGVPMDAWAEGRELDLSDETTDDGLLGLHTLARISSARALLSSREGNGAEAVEDALYGLRAGQVVAAHEDIDLMGLMIVGATQSISLRTLEQVVRESSLPPAIARRITDEIAQGMPTRANWQQMWVNEYRWVRTQALKAFEQGMDPEALMDTAEVSWASWPVRILPDDYMIQPNRTLANIASRYRARRDQTGGDCLSIYTRESDEMTVMDQLNLLVRPNPVGELLGQIAQPNFGYYELKRCGFEKNFALAQVVVASKAYLDREGHLPDTLDALVPDYLAAVPINPYEGGVLGYSEREGAVTVDTREIATVLGPDRAAALDGQSMGRKL